MAEGKILGTDFVDQSAHEEFKKLTTEADELLKKFLEMAGGAKAFREALAQAGTIKETTDAIKKKREQLSEMEKLQKQVIDTNQRLVNAETQLGKALAFKREQLREVNQVSREDAQLTKAKAGSYVQLDVQLKQMIRNYKALSEAERNAAKGTEMLKKIQETRLGLGALDATMGDHRRNVGNYATASMGLTQVLRELPAFTYSVQTGIMGISNNIPMLIDDFRKLRTEGNSFGGALGIMGKSMFSFTNIASIAIGVFTIFYKQIAAYVDSLNDASGKQKELNKVLEQGEKDAQAQVSTAERLYLTTQNLTLSIEARKKAVDKLQETYPAYFGNLSDEAILNGDAKTSYDELIKSIIAAGRARALESKIQEEINNDMDKEMRLRRSLQEATSEEMAKRGKGMTMQRRSGTDKEITNIDISPEAAEALRIQKKAIAKKELDDFKQNQSDRLKIYEDALMKETAITERKPSGLSGGGSDKKKGKEINRIEEIKKQYEVEQKLLETKLNDGLITEEDYYGKSIDLARKYRGEREGLSKKEKESEVALNLELSKAESESYEDLLAWLTKGVEAQAEADDQKLKNFQKYVEERKRKNAEYAQQELDLIRENLESQQRMLDGADEEERKRIAKKVEAWQAYADIANSLNAAGSALADIGYQREISAISERDRAQQSAYENEKKRIESQFVNKAERERELAKLEATREAEKKKIDADRLRAERKRAQLQKGFDIAGIITSTALAIMTALTEKGPLGIARAAAAGITGVTQLTRAIAAPLPQYWEGTENHPGGPAIVGEKGVELVQEPGGKSYLTPSTATLMNLPARTKVIPHEDLIAAAHAAAYKKMAQFNGPVNTSSQQDAIIQAFDEKLDELIKAYKMSDRTPNISVIVDSNHRAWVEANIS